MSLPPVPHRAQVIGPDGFLTPVWANWFQQLFTDGSSASADAISALTGDVTATGPGSVAATIANGVITNSKISASAAIARSKIATGTANHVVIDDGTGALSSEATLAISRGGTNSGTALNNNRIMQSLGGKIVEAAALTADRALISDVNGIPIISTVTGSEIGFLSGVTGGVQAQLDGKQTTNLANGKILIGSGGGTATAQSVTGDISLSNAGVTAYSGTVPLNKGGTGQTTKAAAFDALSPMSTIGDIIYGGTAGTGTRLAIGTTGAFLQAISSTAVGWVSDQAYSATITGTMTTTSATAADLTVASLVNTAITNIGWPTVTLAAASAGWTFTPTRLGILKISVMAQMNPSANSNSGLLIADGSNNAISGPTLSNHSASGTVQTVTVFGFISVSSLSVVTIKLRPSISAGTLTVLKTTLTVSY
jgi:hypothetical protein